MSERGSPLLADGRRAPPLGMSQQAFLRRCWQKRPLLVRQAFPGFEGPLSPDDLAGLACEPMALSRLVTHRVRDDRWTVRSGPFKETDFARLPKRDWTVLVQDCDKLIDEVEALLAPFRFLTDWRIDDVMVSYAAPGGSVGAHIDQYDVFLLQGLGRRHWMISTDAQAPREFRPDAELKLLREFAPTHEWTLEPGDMLYLPPGVPHHGVAEGECMTWSIGLRAPAVGEMLLEFAEQLAERLGEELRYADPDLAPTRDPALIDARAIARVRAALRRASSESATSLAADFARFITRYRSAHAPSPAEVPIERAALRHALDRGGVLHRSPWSRYAWLRERSGATLWFAGEAFASTLRLARLLQSARSLDAATTSALNAHELDTLCALHNAGHMVIAHDD
jgi:50S ribosomal protein L16 3-hydroxylase